MVHNLAGDIAFCFQATLWLVAGVMSVVTLYRNVGSLVLLCCFLYRVLCHPVKSFLVMVMLRFILDNLPR